MKQNAKLLLFFVASALVLSGCFEKDEFSNRPNIEFLDVQFFDRDESIRTDSLVLSFQFQDGDADLGLEGSIDDLPPFHEYFVFLDSQDSLVTISNLAGLSPPFYTAPAALTTLEIIGFVGNTLLVGPSDEPLSAAPINIFGYDRRLFDTSLDLPEYSCADYQIVETGRPVILNRFVGGFLEKRTLEISPDTIPILRNELRFNLHVDILRKTANGDFEEFFLGSRLGSENCGVGELDARFPIFGDGSGTEGTVHYDFTSQTLRLGFQDDIYKLSFYIFDRAGRQSNVAETFEFSLADISQ